MRVGSRKANAPCTQAQRLVDCSTSELRGTKHKALPGLKQNPAAADHLNVTWFKIMLPANERFHGASVVMFFDLVPLPDT